LYALQIAEDKEVWKSGFIADREELDKEGLSDGEDDNDESAGASPMNDESGEEEEDEMLGHLSKSSHSASLKY
jgi:hypothetical protein